MIIIMSIIMFICIIIIIIIISSSSSSSSLLSLVSFVICYIVVVWFGLTGGICSGRSVGAHLLYMTISYAQSAYWEFGFRRVWLKQTLNSKGWEFPCPSNFIGSLPESLTQGLLVGKLLVGGLGVRNNFVPREPTNILLRSSYIVDQRYMLNENNTCLKLMGKVGKGGVTDWAPVHGDARGKVLMLLICPYCLKFQIARV